MAPVNVHKKNIAKVESIPFMKDNEADAKLGPTLWTPFFMRPASFVGFGCSYILLGVALGVLYYSSKVNRGLVTTEAGLHYLWTYGPTALLTVVSSLWALVNFRTKQLMPWKVLLDGPAKAEQTLLLDYITPWAGSVLWKSFKARHFPVLCSEIGSLLLKLLIIFSTGLFTLETMQLSKVDVPLTLSNQFSGSGFNNSTVDWRPLAMLTASEYPLGTNKKYAFETFNATDTDRISPNATLTGIVDAFHTNMSCRVLADKIEFPVHSYVVHSNQYIDPYNFTSVDDRDIKFNVTGENIDIITPDCHLKIPFNSGIGWEAYIANCDGRVALDYGGFGFPWTDVISHNDHDLLLNVALSIFKEGSSDTDLIGQQLTTVHCRMNYNIIPSYLTIDNPLDPVARLGPSLENNDNRTLPGVSMLGILQGINNALESYPNEDEPSSSIVKQSTLYDVFNITTPRQPTEEMTEWQDAKVLKEAAETSMPALAAQIAYFYLLHPSDETAIINGSMTSQQQRLVVRTLSFGLMEGTFGLLLLLTVAMFFIAPRAVCPRDPTSIGGLAMILAPSTALHHSYQGTASWDFKTLKKATEDQQYQAAISDSTFLLAESIPNSGVDNPPLQKSSSSDQANKIRWWRPLSATIPMQSLVFGLPIGLIIALEVLYQHSQKHHGVADIKSEDSYARYAYAYLPALAMFLVGVLYDSIDLTARLMQPYSLLRKNPQRADRGLFNAQAGKWSPSSLFDSIRLGFPAVAATSVAIIVAKLLSIAVSGLFSPEPSVWGSPISAIRTDDFDFTNYYADVDGTMDGNTLSGMLILNTNLSYPQWTYEDLAFPAIQLQNHGDIANTVTSNSSSSGGSSGRTVQMNLPAVRVQTNCTILDDTNSDILFTAGPNPDTQISLRVHVPNYCDNFNQTWHFSNPSYFGSANEASPAVTAVSRGVQPPIAEQNDCARWITFAGYAHNNSTTNNVNNNNTVSALLCSPYFESVQTTVTFTLPSLTIDPSNPPIIRNENNTKHLASFNNKTQLPEEDDVFVTPSKLTQLEAPYELPYPVDVDQMFSAVAFGRGGTPITELVGPQNIGNLQKAIQHTFGILQAQHVNYQFRIPRTLDATNANDNGGNVLNGTLHNPNRVRMVQSGISTRILEAILAVMLVCALIAFWTMDTWHILPMEPGSIAVVLGLLVAGPGQILSNKIMPQGAQWWSDEKIRKTGVFDGWLFSLGWGKQGDDGDEQQEEKDFGIWARRIH